MRKICVLLDSQLGLHWDTHSTLNGVGCLAWTTEQSSWVSAQRGNLYNNRAPSQAGQLHPATDKKAGSPPPHAIRFSIYTLPVGSHPVYSPHAWRSCPSLAPAAYCMLEKIPCCETHSIVCTSLQATTTGTLCPCNLQGCYSSCHQLCPLTKMSLCSAQKREAAYKGGLGAHSVGL